MAHATSINPPPPEQAHDLVTLNVPIGRRCCAACVELVKRRLRENAHVRNARVDAFEGVAYVEADAGTVSIEELSQLAGECCGARNPVPFPDAAVSSHQHAHTVKLEDSVHAPEAHAPAEAGHAGMAHGGHDMSDPRMAAAMEADMRRRTCDRMGSTGRAPWYARSAHSLRVLECRRLDRSSQDCSVVPRQRCRRRLVARAADD